jgi:Ca2+ transporting ATPase
MRFSSRMMMEDFGGPTGVIQALFTNPKTGIDGTDEDRKDRIRIYGENRFAPPKIKTIGELIMENFEDTINRVLLGAAVVSLIIGIYQEGFPKGLIEGVSIMIALVIIITVTSVNNYISEKRLAELVALSNVQEVAVFRGSDKPETIDATELVVGDLVKFAMGEKVPADMIMVDGQDVTCNEAELTGEPDSLEKVALTLENYREGGVMCTMLAKSLIDGGIGKAIVMAVGPATVAGVITEKTQTGSEMTLLQKKLDKMAGKIGNIGLSCAVATFLSCVIRIVIEMLGGIPCQCMNIFVCKKVDGCEMYDFADLSNRVYSELLMSIIIGITVVVVAIPEGLPLAVTISLSFSSAKMQKLNNLVRKIASSETMGGATHICSDKTGTLTENKMTVMATMAVERVIMAEGDSIDLQLASNGEEQFSAVQSRGQTVWNTLVEGVLWNSSAWIEQNEDGIYETKGNVTEQGIIKYFLQSSLQVQGCLSKKAELTDDKTLCIIPFTSSRKMGSIVVRNPQKAGTEHEVRVYTKGAPDMLLQKVTQVVKADGTIDSIENRGRVPRELLVDGEGDGSQDTFRNFFERTVKKFAMEAYRTLLITYKDMSMQEFNRLKAANDDFAKEKNRLVLETDLIAVGLFGLQDPLRSTIKGSIEMCHNAGIQVIMCTGDNIDTATAISKNAGIISEEEVANNEFSCMTGLQFRNKVGGLKKVKMEDGTEVDAVGDMGQFREVKE